MADWDARRGPLDSDSPYLLHKRKCAVCEEGFRAMGIGILYCSPECKIEARRQRRAEEREPKKPIRCAFTPIRSTAQFCSTRCRMAAHRGAT